MILFIKKETSAAYLKEIYIESNNHTASAYHSIILIPVIHISLYIYYIFCVMISWYILQYFEIDWNQWLVGIVTGLIFLFIYHGLVKKIER